MKKRFFTLFVAVLAVITFAASAYAVPQRVELKTTVPNIPKSACYQAGTITLEFSPGTTMVNGDVIQFTLNEGVVLCRDIELFYPVVDGTKGFFVKGTANSQIVTLILGTMVGGVFFNTTDPVNFTVPNDASYTMSLFDEKLTSFDLGGNERSLLKYTENVIYLDTLTYDYQGERVEIMPISFPIASATALIFTGEREIARIVYVGEPNIEVSPTGYDFGNVEWGQTSTATFTISNIGNVDLAISEISLPVGYEFFSISSAPSLPINLESGQSTEVQVTFSPIHSFTGMLEIKSNGVDEPLKVPLSGKGVLVETPSEQVTAVTGYIRDSIAADALKGEGSGNSAEKKVNALISMIEAAGDLLEAGQIAEGCQQLSDILLKVDGISPPPDFVSGPATEGLAGAIEGFMTRYDCK